MIIQKERQFRDGEWETNEGRDHGASQEGSEDPGEDEDEMAALGKTGARPWFVLSPCAPTPLPPAIPAALP